MQENVRGVEKAVAYAVMVIVPDVTILFMVNRVDVVENE
jgi:hypothetical protein